MKLYIFETYDCRIGYLYSYHPYRKNGAINPAFKRETDGKILNLKEGKEEDINYFYGELYKLCNHSREKIENFYFCAVPSSKASVNHSPMQEICARLSRAFGKEDYSNVLKRLCDISKLSTGGNRNPEVHYKSIEVAKGYNVKNRNFILLDDVTTTGGSLIACKNILENAGADKVICLALAHTTRE